MAPGIENSEYVFTDSGKYNIYLVIYHKGCSKKSPQEMFGGSEYRNNLILVFFVR